jgi:hypothetical protein
MSTNRKGYNGGHRVALQPSASRLLFSLQPKFTRIGGVTKAVFVGGLNHE